MATVTTRLERLEKHLAKHNAGARCQCWKDAIYIDDGLAELPPEDGADCPKCGKPFRGVPGMPGYFIIQTI